MQFARAQLADCVGAPAASQASFAGATRDIVATLPRRGPLVSVDDASRCGGFACGVCVRPPRSFVPTKKMAYEYVRCCRTVMVMGV